MKREILKEWFSNKIKMDKNKEKKINKLKSWRFFEGS